MVISSDMVYGHVESIILRCLMDKDCYGYEISRYISEKTRQEYEMKEATLYTAFRRLEKQGYIRSYWGDESMGARRRYYSITGAGKEYFHKKMREWVQMKKLLGLLFA